MITEIGARGAQRTNGHHRERSIKARPRPKFPVRKPGVKAAKLRVSSEVIVC